MRKNIEISSIQEVSQLQKSVNGKDIAILIGTSLSWLSDTASALRQKNIRPVVLSAQKRQRLGYGLRLRAGRKRKCKDD